MWSATVVRTIRHKDKVYREGETIEPLSDQLMHDLFNAGVIGNMKRIADDVETAITEAPEDTARNYRRRGR